MVYISIEFVAVLLYIQKETRKKHYVKTTFLSSERLYSVILFYLRRCNIKRKQFSLRIFSFIVGISEKLKLNIYIFVSINKSRNIIPLSLLFFKFLLRSGEILGRNQLLSSRHVLCQDVDQLFGQRHKEEWEYYINRTGQFFAVNLSFFSLIQIIKILKPSFDFCHTS